MSIRRAATTIGAISLGLVALTACDKPTAQATVTVGTRTVTAEAADKCYADGKKLPQQIFVACLQAKPTHHITVGVGDKVRIGVDPSIGKKGWLVVRNTSLVTSEVLKDKTYWTVDGDQLFSEQDPQTGQTSVEKSVTLNIVESSDTSGQESYRVIQFTLTRGK
ncbi:hypothetical protein VSR01_14975 [Actinacidiphila sp. DG2A-62]|jgi:hypothetical protein|uniref:hypothetical protein n=1 Tax=Actinacidiphila sp. DG2A-62 TaxID=3108821 RepID=UPI002DBBC067|nr:hypothetical protein [Actinacidiphila sp. DG2A-62]MEC3994757.1 hypothetical protein [Actinacidiphila sp. DG2A-62]